MKTYYTLLNLVLGTWLLVEVIYIVSDFFRALLAGYREARWSRVAGVGTSASAVPNASGTQATKNPMRTKIRGMSELRTVSKPKLQILR
jgi:hypothetical protein